MYSLLIDKTYFTSECIIPQNTETAKVERAILEAQTVDLRQLIGNEFYYDILTNYDKDDSGSGSTIYEDLMMGKEYAGPTGKTISFGGLAKALKYWSYARFVANNQVNVTSAGVTVKTNPDSMPAEQKSIDREVANAREIAMAHWEEVELFLNVNSQIYPLWRGELGSPRKGVNFFAVGGQSKREYDKATKRWV